MLSPGPRFGSPFVGFIRVVVSARENITDLGGLTEFSILSNFDRRFNCRDSAARPGVQGISRDYLPRGLSRTPPCAQVVIGVLSPVRFFCVGIWDSDAVHMCFSLPVTVLLRSEVRRSKEPYETRNCCYILIDIYMVFTVNISPCFLSGVC